MNPDTRKRGQILQMLEVNRGMEIPLDFILLWKSLDNIGVSLTTRDLRRHLDYLNQKGYVNLRRLRDVIGDSPPARGNDDLAHVQTVQLTAKGLDLLQRSIPADPGVLC